MSIFLGIAIMFDFINAFIAVMMNDFGRAIIFTIIGGVLFYLKSRIEAGVYKSKSLKENLVNADNGEDICKDVADFGIVSGETGKDLKRKYYRVTSLCDGIEIDARFVIAFSKPLQCLLFNENRLNYVNLLFSENDVKAVSIKDRMVGVGLLYGKSFYMTFDSEEYAKEVYDLLLKVNSKGVKRHVQRYF